MNIIIFSICSLLYQIILTEKLSIHFNGDLFAYPVSLAIFLFAMSINFLSRKKISFIRNEFFLMLSFLTTYIISLFDFQAQTFIILSGSFLVGYFSGIEFHCLLKKYQFDKKIIFYDYIGSFIGSLIFINYFNIIHTSFLVIIVITINIIAILKEEKKDLYVIFCLILLTLSNYYKDIISNKHDRIYYKLQNNEKIIVNKNTRFAHIITVESPTYIKTFLNKSIQYIIKKDSYELDFYHKFLKQTFEKQKCDNSLILGGGDGLPLRVIKGQTTLVDINNEWINLNLQHEKLKLIHQNKLKDTNLIIENAFEFVKTTKNKYDCILVDFPEYESLENIRIHSLSFLNNLYQILDKDGIIVYQDDKGIPESMMTIIRTTNDFAQFNTKINKFYFSKNNHLTQIILTKKKNNHFKYNKNNINYFLNPLLMRERIKLYLKDLL